MSSSREKYEDDDSNRRTSNYENKEIITVPYSNF